MHSVLQLITLLLYLLYRVVDIIYIVRVGVCEEDVVAFLQLFWNGTFKENTVLVLFMGVLHWFWNPEPILRVKWLFSLYELQVLGMANLEVHRTVEETLDLLPLVAEMGKVEPEFALIGRVLDPTHREEETGFSTIIIFKGHVRIPIWTHASLELVDGSFLDISTFVGTFQSQNSGIWQRFVRLLVWLDFMALH